MKDLFSKCGYRCGRCPSYKENLQTDEDRQRCSDGWERYHNFRFSLEKLRRCDGCQTPDDENPVLYISCIIRRCAFKSGVETCAHCSAYPCEVLIRRTPGPDWPEKIAARLKTSIPEEDYSVYVEPYEGIKHLDDIRASLSPEDITEISRVSAKPKIVDFPESFSTQEMSPYKSLHELITTVESKSDVSFAQKEELKKRRRHLVKILWTFGLHGEMKDSSLVIDSATYIAQKIHSNYEVLKGYFDTFKEYGVHCELIPLKEEKYGRKGWLTPTGALRKTGWFMKMSFDDAGGVSALKALQSYAAHLDEKYGTKAFTYFSKADMRTLKEVI